MKWRMERLPSLTSFKRHHMAVLKVLFHVPVLVLAQEKAPQKIVQGQNSCVIALIRIILQLHVHNITLIQLQTAPGRWSLKTKKVIKWLLQKLHQQISLRLKS